MTPESGPTKGALARMARSSALGMPRRTKQLVFTSRPPLAYRCAVVSLSIRV
jgi:hypothetical protein